MIEDHADYVLAKLSVVYPNKTLTVEEVRFWVEKLAPYDFDDGMEAIDMIADSCKFWPSWSEFRECLQALTRKNRLNVRALPEPVSTPAGEEDVRRFIAAARQTLRPLP